MLIDLFVFAHEFIFKHLKHVISTFNFVITMIS